MELLLPVHLTGQVGQRRSDSLYHPVCCLIPNKVKDLLLLGPVLTFEADEKSHGPSVCHDSHAPQSVEVGRAIQPGVWLLARFYFGPVWWQ